MRRRQAQGPVIHKRELNTSCHEILPLLPPTRANHRTRISELESPERSLCKAFVSVEEPHCPIVRRCFLSQMIVTEFAAVPAGSGSCKDIEVLGHPKAKSLRQFLTLRQGIRSV